MCTVTFLPKGKGNYILTSNRDETPKRGAAPPQVYKIHGQEWFDFLLKEQISFYIRIKNNSLVSLSDGNVVKAYQLFPHKAAYTLYRVKIGKNILNLSGMHLGKGEYLIIATDTGAKNALGIYKERWQIEMFFSCLKTRGFRLEETHMNDPEKLKQLIALISLAFLWCHQSGEQQHLQEPIKTKSHGRKANNLFRYGLDYLRKIISPFVQNTFLFQQAIKLFAIRISTMVLKINC